MEVHHTDVKLALGLLHFSESSPQHQQTTHEEETVDAKSCVLNQHGVWSLSPGEELVSVNMGQVVEGHVTVSEDNPHHRETTNSIHAFNDVRILAVVIDSEHFLGVGDNGESKEKIFSFFCGKE